MIIDCIGCCHGYFPQLEGGDLLIITGDLTARDTVEEYMAFHEWIRKQNYKKVVVIAGNHDNCLKNGFFTGTSISEKWLGFQYLCDSGTEFEYQKQIDHPASTEHVSIDVLMYERKKLKIWGSPWSLTFPEINPHCTAFTGNEELLAEKFALIPEDTDILITHTPPFGILDGVVKNLVNGVECIPGFVHVGSKALGDRIQKMPRPRLHVFSHIHELGGRKKQYGSTTTMVNCSIMNEAYQPTRNPVRIEL